MDSLSLLFKNETFISAANDILKVGAMIIMARIFSSRSIQDKEWISMALYLMLGFAVYHILIRHIINVHSFVDMYSVRTAIDDFIKFGIVLIVIRLAQTQNINSLTDSNWLKQIAIILTGFALYDLIVAKIVSKFNVPLNAGNMIILSDVLKFGSMFVVLKWFKDGNLTDPSWMKEVGAALGGLAIYHYISQRAVSFGLY